MGADRLPLHERARGRWRGILASLGFTERELNGKHGPCPICRIGHDRFRFDDKDGRGTFICTKCGAGDGVRLVMLARGIEFREAAERIESVMGDAPIETRRQERPDEDKRAALNRLWKSAKPIVPTDPAGLFLHARVGLTEFPRSLRFVERLRYEDDVPSWHPAMLAMVRNLEGRPANLHRTYLTLDGQKAPVASPRRTMPGSLPPGAAVRLFPAAETMGVAEGIETAFAAAKLFGVPVWSTLNSTLLAQWIAPAETRRVIVFGDRDPKFGGQAAAYALAHRLSAGRDAIEATVELPGRDGADWNDVLKERS